MYVQYACYVCDLDATKLYSQGKNSTSVEQWYFADLDVADLSIAELSVAECELLNYNICLGTRRFPFEYLQKNSIKWMAIQM